MTIDLATLGQRLRQARTNCGLTQDSAAQALGLPRTAVVHLESGNREISTLELAEFAKLYQRPIAEFFEPTPESSNEDAHVALCRVATEFADHPEVGKNVSRYLDLCQEGVALERILDRPVRTVPPAYELPDPRTHAEAAEQGQSVATEERRRLDILDAPIYDLPDLIAGQGIWVAAATLPNEMSGLFLHHISLGMAILVNRDHENARRRFSYAHEYAHALLDRRRTVRVTTKGNRDELIERRANTFAAAFLMPAIGVVQLLRMLDKGAPSRTTYTAYDVAGGEMSEAQSRTTPGSQEITFKDVAMVAHHFGVSYQAAAYRLIDLGYINRDSLNSLLSHEQPYGKPFLKALGLLDDLEKVEPNKDADERELRSQIVLLAVEAYRRDELTRGRFLELCEKLGLPGPQLMKLAEATRR